MLRSVGGKTCGVPEISGRNLGKQGHIFGPTVWRYLGVKNRTDGREKSEKEAVTT